jgi:carbon monoxide dehydrogenase subunit G
MDLTYAFRLPMSRDEAWAALTDVNRVAEAIPGAVVESVADDVTTGQLTVKVGPMSVRYGGTLAVQSQTPEAGVAVLRAQGTDARDGSEATGSIAVTVTPDDADTTLVALSAALDVNGRIARFGPGVLRDVGERMVGQLAASFGGELVEVPVRAPAAAEGWDDEIEVAEAEVVEAEVADVEVADVELGDAFEAVEPDDADLEPVPTIPDPVLEPEPAPAVPRPEVARPEVARPPSPGRKVAPVLAAIAVLWVLKKLLTRAKP